MNERTVERIARTLARDIPRRTAIGMAVAAIVAGTGAVDASAAFSRRVTCRALGASCTRNANCCTGACATGRNEPRRRRNRCVCARQCDGRICGDDGCGGVCGTCEAGLMCTDDGSACEDPCLGYDPDGPFDFCVGTSLGERVLAYNRGFHTPWSPDGMPFFCEKEDDCQLAALCEADAYRCLCQHSYRFDDQATPADNGTNSCLAARVEPPSCTSAGLGTYSKCATTVTGEELGFNDNLFYLYDFFNRVCSTDADCQAPVCNEPNRRCYCEIASWYGTNSGGWNAYAGGMCQMVSL